MTESPESLMCQGCPAKVEKTCTTLMDKVDCFHGLLYDEGLVNTSNGTERWAINEMLLKVLKRVEKKGG